MDDTNDRREHVRREQDRINRLETRVEKLGDASQTRDVTLREYVELQIASLRREMTLINESSDRSRQVVDKALDEYKTNLVRKLEEMNEVRSQLRTQAGTFVSQDAFIALAERQSRAEEANQQRFRALELTGASDRGRNMTLVGIGGVIITLLSLGLRFLP